MNAGVAAALNGGNIDADRDEALRQASLETKCAGDHFAAGRKARGMMCIRAAQLRLKEAAELGS